MSWELVAEGTNLADVASYESEIAEEQKARLSLQCATPVPTFQMDELRNSLEFAGVTEVQVTGSGNTLHIIYRKGAFWIPVIISLVLILAIVVILWQFFKDIPVGVTSIVLIGAAVLALALSYNMFRREYT